MSPKKKPLIIAAIALAVFIVGVIGIRSVLSNSSKRSRNTVQTVKTALSEQKSLPVMVRSNGYVTAVKTVEVRPQVQNIVRAVHVKEGQDVAAGQLLFTLDPRMDAAGVDKAQAQLARDRADLSDAEAALKRNQELLAKKFISQAVVDTAKAKVDALRSAARADRAGIQSSHVSLGYNRITASMAGRIGAINVHPGSLVQPTGAPMVTIAQLDPITISFTVPEAELAHISAAYQQGKAPVSIQLQDKTELQGSLIFIDNATDQQSGTIKMKAQFDNPTRRLWPGVFVAVRMVSRTLKDAVIVPAQAIVTGPKERFVYIVQNDGSVQPKTVTVVATEGGSTAVTGIGVGLRVVTEGSQNLRPGSKVRELSVPAPAPSPASVSDSSTAPSTSAASRPATP